MVAAIKSSFRRSPAFAADAYLVWTVGKPLRTVTVILRCPAGFLQINETCAIVAALWGLGLRFRYLCGEIFCLC